VEADRLLGAVKAAGFKPGEVRYILVGKLADWQGQPAVQVTGSDRLLVLQPLLGTPAPFEQARSALLAGKGETVVVEGQYVDPAVAREKTAPAALRVTRLQMGSP
jgi:hypothetical protein